MTLIHQIQLSLERTDVLFTYDTQKARLDLEKAKLDVEQMENSQKLLADSKEKLEKEKKSASAEKQLSYSLEIQEKEAEILEGNYKIQAKKKEIETLSSTVSNANVVSPTDGTIRTISNGSEGAPAEGSDAAAFIVISKTDEILIMGTVDESNKKDISNGMAVTVKSRVDDTTWKGTVTKVEFDKPVQNTGGYVDTAQSSKYAFYVSLESMEGLVVGQHVYILTDQLSSGETEIMPDGGEMQDSEAVSDGEEKPVIDRGNSESPAE